MQKKAKITKRVSPIPIFSSGVKLTIPEELAVVIAEGVAN